MDKEQENLYNEIISKYNNFTSSQKEEIKFGLEKNLDVSIYTIPDYDWSQMQQIRFGLKNNVDVSYFINQEYGSDRMLEIRLGLENKIYQLKNCRFLFVFYLKIFLL